MKLQTKNCHYVIQFFIFKNSKYSFARNIKRLRCEHKLTQMEMGEILGYSERTIRRLETNGTYDIGVINFIAKSFNVTALSILF